jgi:2-C-methyl-D-erythritol 4-phosphate cytidylyltransferase
MSVALILAAGSGERLGADRPKAFVELAGRPMFAWSAIALARTRGVERIVIAVPAEAPDGAPELSIPLGHAPEMLVVAGGAVRSESVRRALEAVGPGDPVLVHDAARPLLTGALAETVIAALEADPQADAAIAAVPMTDTIKRADERGTVLETLERSELWAVQTPQVFHRAALERALRQPADVLARATDDAWLVERAGGKVVVVAASEQNLKVTTPLDLRVAELLLRERASQAGPEQPA